MVSKLIQGWSTEELALAQSSAVLKCGFNKERDKERDRRRRRRSETDRLCNAVVLTGKRFLLRITVGQ